MDERNPHWLKIGEFAQMCGASAKTLRFYDEQGILHPIHRDNENGYRYYDISQYYTYALIKYLRALDFGVGEIAGILQQDDPRETMTLLLSQQASEIGREIERLEGRRKATLDAISMLMEHSHAEDGIIKLEYLPPRQVLVFKTGDDLRDSGAVVKAMAEIWGKLAEQLEGDPYQPFIRLGGIIRKENLESDVPYNDELVAFLDSASPKPIEGITTIPGGMHLSTYCFELSHDLDYTRMLVRHAHEHDYAITGDLYYEGLNYMLYGHSGAAEGIAGERILLPVAIS